MLKQLELIQMESSNITAEVAVKKSPLMKALKYALVGITAFIALVILFAVGASVINPAVDSFAQKLGIGDQIVVAETSPVAYAEWSNPSPNTGDTGVSRRATSTTSYTWKVQNQTNTLTPQTAHSGWNWGYRFESGSNATIGSDGSVSTDNNDAFTLRTLFYVDIYIDPIAQQAIANGQIKTCSVTLAATGVGTGNKIDRGTINGTFFLCASTTGTSSASAHDMGTSASGYYYTGTACPNDDGGTGDWFNDCNYWDRHNYTSNKMTLTLKSDMKKIRFGIYYRTTKDSGLGSAEVFAPCPTISTSFTTDTYKNGKLKFQVSGGDELCNIVSVTSSNYSGTSILNSWSGTAAYSSAKTLGGVTVGNVIASPAPGYYFSGWKISSGSLSSSYDLRSTTLNIVGGPYLKASTETTIIAYFKKIEITGYLTDYTYLQENNADGTIKLEGGMPIEIGQGPSAVTPASNNDTGVGSVNFVLVGGVYDANNPTFSSNGNMYLSTDAQASWKSNSKPTDVGQYRFMVGVFISGKENSNANVLGYYISDVFNINQVSISGTGTSNIPNREYSGNEYRPTPEYVDITANGGRAYRLLNATIGGATFKDYDITRYDNNVNVGNTANLQITSKGNFIGQPTVFFTIERLNINAPENNFSVVSSMASDIQSRYGLVYDGFGQRPDVIRLDITGKVLKQGNMVDKSDENNLTTTTFTIYVQTKDEVGYYNDNCQKYGYESVTASSSLNYFYIVGRDAGEIDPHSIYKNNVDASAGVANFDIEIIESASNMYGNLTVYFDIAQLDLDNLPDGARVTKTYDQTKEEVYVNKAITPIPDVVYVSVSGLSPYVWSATNNAYGIDNRAVTFVFTREGASVVVDESISGVSGSAFSSSNAYFNGGYVYANNENVAYRDGGSNENLADVIANASISFNLNETGNVRGGIETLFKINPRNLSQLRSEIGEGYPSSKVGEIINTGESLISYYQGVDANGNHIPVTPTSTVKAYPAGNGVEEVLQASDFYFTYSNNTTVTREAVITANGIGNYTGSISGTFYILAMDVSTQTFKVSNLEDESYTGRAINPTPTTLTATVNGVEITLRDTFDYVITAGTGENTSVYTGNDTARMPYITINLTGYARSDSDKGLAVQGNGGNYYGKGIKVYFNITPKDLNDFDVTKYASWKNYQSEVTYTGASLQWLSLITSEAERDANTLYLCDTTANADRLLEHDADGDGLGDYKVIGWGENINAGDNTGSVTVQGIGNYTGVCEITFKIYPRSITTNSNNIEITYVDSYEYTGSMIEAEVSSVIDSGLDKNMVFGSDYVISYGDGSPYDSAKLNLNYDVLVGGTVTVVGSGNYTGSKTVKFDITPKAQNVILESPYGNGYNNTLAPESKATDSSKTIYADYEINVTEINTLTVVGYTDAIYPLRRLTFKLINVSGTTSGIASVSYDKVELVVKDGKQMAKTTATITFTNSGIVRIYAEQYDNTITSGSLTQDGIVGVGDKAQTYFNRGNYVNYTYNKDLASDKIYSVYGKNQDFLGEGFLTEYNKIYGNDPFAVSPSLKSYGALSKALDGYTVVSDNTDVCRIQGASGIDRTAIVGSVGQATVTISHTGYVPAEGEADGNAYVAFSATFTVNVAKRNLIISFAHLEVEYGETPEFVYTYTTQGQGKDGYTSLTYLDRTDDINDIIQGYGVDYSTSAHGSVSTENYSIMVKAPESDFFNANVDSWSLYKNYNVSYEESTLLVTKKQLIVTATNTSELNKVIKTYGDENPTDYVLGYEGFVNGETASTLEMDTAFIAPTLDFSGVSGGDKVTKYSSAKEYNVLLTGGQSSNYSFAQVLVKVVVNPAPVQMLLGWTTDGEFIESLTGVIIEKDYDTHAYTLAQDNVMVVGENEDGEYVIAGKVTFRYSKGTTANTIPQLAGSYSVNATFVPAEGVSDYKETTIRFDGAIVINKGAPNINVSAPRFEYTGGPVPESDVTVIIAGLLNGSIVANQYPERKLYELDPSLNYEPEVDENGVVISFDESKYSTITPTEKGKYDVIIVYRANTDDEAYCSATKYFKDKIEITSGVPTIEFTGSTIERVYDGEGHGFTKANFNVTYKGGLYDSYGTETVLYSQTGNDDDWTEELPVNVGEYQVKVIFTAFDGAPVGNNVGTFGVRVKITPFDLSTPGYVDVDLEGISSGWHVYGYDAKEHSLKNTEIVLKGVYADEQAGKKPSGTVTILYVNTASGEETPAPINAGNYKVKITYNLALEGVNNYYASSVIVLDKTVVQINTAEVTIEDVQTTHSYSYTGNGRPMPSIYFHGVETTPGRYDTPKGSLVYEYRVSGSSQVWDVNAPVNVGKYDVRVSYKAVSNDNYYNPTAKVFVGVIEIKAVLPSVIINDVAFDYGEEIIPSYVIRGAQADENGPMNAIDEGIAIVVVEYGTRYTSSSGKIEYDWSENKPTASGKYSVKVTYYVLQSGSSNYNTNSVTKQDCLTINNIKPYFTLENKTVSYTGSRVNAGQVKIFDSATYDNEYVKWYEGIDEDVNCYYGTIGYEYSKAGMNVWSPTAPYEVGLYDVRVRYYENSRNDVFKGDTLIFTEALEIKQVVITVMPLYGQGRVYDGSYTNGDAVAYVYSYVLNGYKYLVYSTVSTANNNEIVDISSAEYVDENGFVYSIITDASLTAKAWRDYYTAELTLLTGSFVDGNDKVEFNYAELDDITGKVAFSAGGKDYVIDLDRGIVRLNDGVEYTLGVQHDGYYFSVVNGEGAVNVISIDVSKIVSGIYNVTTGGQTKSYKVDLNAKKVTDENGNSYDIYNTVGIVSYEQDGRVMSIMVDHASYYSVSEDGIAIYKHANGSAYLIDLNTSKVEKVAVLKVETAKFSYYDYEGVTNEFTFNVSELRSIYSSNAYVGKLEVREGYSAIVNLTEKSVRLQTYFALTKNGSLYTFVDANGQEDIFTLDQLVATEVENVYLYYSGYLEDYYVDLGAMTVRNVKNLFTFNVVDNTISQETDGVTTTIQVDVREFTYNVTKNGRLYGVTKLFGSEYDVEKTTLIAGNKWSGSMKLGAQDAGSHEIGVGSLAIGANYQIIFVNGVEFIIDRAEISVTFTAMDEEIYNGISKKIGYDVQGLVEGETENVISVKQEYDGDTVNVTQAGYRAKITVSALNYYVANGTINAMGESIVYSDYYYITPAEMAPITFTRGEDIVYDGLKHYLELKNVERGAKVTYAGSTTAPYFREPGIYSVIATVSKENYVSQEVELTMVIAKAKYQVNVFEVPGTLTYGDALPTLRCDSQEGTVALDPGQVLLPNVTTYTWTFTPYNQEFYKYYEGNSTNGNAITGTIELKVQKAQANIQINGNLVQSETSPSAIVGIANGLSHNESDLVTIEYIAPDGTRYAKMPTEAGKYTVVVTYAGDEYHAETVYTTTLTIEAESNYDWLIIIGGVLLGLSVLSTVFFLVRRGKKIE